MVRPLTRPPKADQRAQAAGKVSGKTNAVRLSQEVSQVGAELVRLRREIHQNPELGFEEKKTAALVARHLRESGLEVTEGIARTGVVGLLRGGRPGKPASRPGQQAGFARKTVLVRADMDALPLVEENKVPYASRHTGVMHA